MKIKLRHRCILLDLLQKCITIHGPVNVKLGIPLSVVFTRAASAQAQVLPPPPQKKKSWPLLDPNYRQKRAFNQNLQYTSHIPETGMKQDTGINLVLSDWSQYFVRAFRISVLSLS